MRAVRDGDHYVINGTKTWISNGIHGHALRAAGEDRPERASRATRA